MGRIRDLRARSTWSRNAALQPRGGPMTPPKMYPAAIPMVVNCTDHKAHLRGPLVRLPHLRQINLEHTAHMLVCRQSLHGSMQESREARPVSVLR